MARAEFQLDLRAVRGALVDMTATAAGAIANATTALLDQDMAAAQCAAEADRALEEARLGVEHRAYQLLALQQPVAGDLRELVSAIKVSADLRRMGSLAHHIAKVAQRRHPAAAVPADLRATFTRMGAVAERIVDGAGVALEGRDATDAARLAIDDDAMDGLRRTLFRALLAGWPHGVEDAINVALLGRYYERFADHAVAVAQSVVYVVTGTLTGEHPEPLH
jgi:phosphate transport system protein